SGRLRELVGQMRFEGFKEEFGHRLAEAEARSQRAPRLRRAQFAGMATALGIAAIVIGTAHSTSKPLAKASSVTGTAPSVENDQGTSPDFPDIYQDFKDSSGGQYVSSAQLAQAKAQAAAVPSSPTPGSWQLTGPANIGGRVVDLVVDNQHAKTIYV